MQPYFGMAPAGRRRVRAMFSTAEMKVDLYSDTQTRPTSGMRRAISEAEVGDEQQDRDPTVNRLRARMAEMLGHEEALFLPTGTMCNLVAVAVHTTPGDSIVTDDRSHIVRSETGGAAAVSGVITDLLPGVRGQFSAGDLRAALAPGHIYRPHPRLVCLEQTHNFGGGAVWSLKRYREAAQIAREHSVAAHTDGARLFNATVATGTDPDVWGEEVDSIWVDFTKGLGAPLGAVLAGSREFIAEARVHKHRHGGAMRQAGIAAAACLYALDHHVERLADDHINASRLAEGLGAMGLETSPAETNMVWIDVSSTSLSAAEFLERLAVWGVRMSRVEEDVRAVTHLDISSADVDIALEAVGKVLDSLS